MSMYYRGRDYETTSPSGLAVDRALLKSLWQLARPVKTLLAAAFFLMIADRPMKPVILPELALVSHYPF